MTNWEMLDSISRNHGVEWYWDGKLKDMSRRCYCGASVGDCEVATIMEIYSCLFHATVELLGGDYDLAFKAANKYTIDEVREEMDKWGEEE